LRKCECKSGCVESTSYRCSNGYYGASTNGATGCNPYPDGGDSNTEKNKLVQDCFITRGRDTAGEFDFDGQKCFYTP
jgi:hypothetical protein